jgi:hypothetical protein
MYQVVIPEWEYYYVKAKKTAPKYWLYKDKDKLPKKYSDIVSNIPIMSGNKLYCGDGQGNRFLKNSKKAGDENIWVLNGQALYSAVLNWRLRKTIAEYYHDYFGKYIVEQLQPIEIPDNTFLSISVDIYEIKRGHIPDVSNMWLLEKFFEDALIEKNIIPDDNPDYVIESGRKRYHWVTDPKDRKLIFNINYINL